MRALALFCMLAVAVVFAGAPRPKTAWRMGQDDWDKVEKKLEEGDDPELLVSEDKIAMDDYDRRRGQGLQPPEEEVALKCVLFFSRRGGGHFFPSPAHRPPRPAPARPPQGGQRVAAPHAGHVRPRHDVCVA